MAVEKIYDNDLVLAIIVRDDDWHNGLNFISNNEDFQQVGLWNYAEGKVLDPHIHLKFDRVISRTQEVLFIKKGSIMANIFLENGKFKQSIKLNTGDLIVLYNGGHGYEILENNTQVVEVKNGPYFGPDQDRRRLTL